MKISLIAAMGNNRELALRGKILWHIPEELQHFKKNTLNHHLLMGRKTFESLQAPLPQRTVIVLTRKKNCSFKNCLMAHDISQAICMAKERGEKELFVCGGEQIYRQTLEMADFIYLSHIDYSVTADTWFPELKDEQWETVKQEMHHFTDENYPFDWWFELLKKRDR